MKTVAVSFIPGISRVISNITPVFILFVFSKFLQPEELGTLNYFIAIITIISILADFGVSAAIQNYLPKSKSPRLIYTTLLLGLLIVFIASTVILVIDVSTNYSISRGYPILLAVISLFSISNLSILVFNGLGNRVKTSVYFILSSILFIAVTFILYFGGYTDPILAFLIGRLVSWIVFTIVPVSDLLINKHIETKFELPKRFLKFSFNNTIVGLSYTLFTQWDSILVINVLGEFQNGIYKSVSFIGNLPYAVAVILQTKLLPEYSSLVHSRDFTKMKKGYLRYTLMLVLTGIIVTVLSFPLAKPAISFIYTPEIANEGSQYLPLLLLAAFIYVASIPSATVLLTMGKDHIVRNASILQGIGFLVLSSLLIIPLGLEILPIILVTLNAIFFLSNLLIAKVSLDNIKPV